MPLEPVSTIPLPTTLPPLTNKAQADPTSKSAADTLTLSSRPPAGLLKAQQAIKGFKGLAWVGIPASNFGQEATLLIPKGFRPDQPAEIYMFYHGKTGSAAESTRTLQRVVEKLPQKGRNTIVIIPSWEAQEEQAGQNLMALQDEAKTTAEKLVGKPLSVSRYTVAGFSRGGKAVAQAAQAGQLRANHILMFDSTYETRGDTVVECRPADATVQVFYTSHNAERAARLRGKAGVSVEPAKTSHSGTPLKHFYR